MAYITDWFGSQRYLITVIKQVHLLYSKLVQTKNFFLQISQKQSVANENERVDLVVNIGNKKNRTVHLFWKKNLFLSV